MWVTVIPAFNPDEILLSLLKDIHKTDNITIVVNDGSSSEKSELFQKVKKYAILLSHDENYGKGHAIKTALRYIAGKMSGVDGVVIMDADGQHTVEDMNKICGQMSLHPNTLLLGVRNFKGEVPVRSRWGNIMTGKIFRMISRTKVTDTQTGLRGFSKELIPLMEKIKGERYEYEMNMLFYCAKQKIPIKEVKIQTIYFDRQNSGSHFRPLIDSMRIFSVIFRFAGSSLFSFFIDYFAFLIFHFIFSAVSYQLIISNILARLVSGTFNFYINKKYVFKNKDNQLVAFMKYCVVAVLILGLNTMILTTLYREIKMSAALAKILTEITLFIVSLVLQRCFVFRKNINRKNGKTSKGSPYV